VILVMLVALLPRFLAITTEPPTTAEAIYVFPGQVPERARCAAALYHAGVAPRVVFTGGQVAAELAAIGQPIDDATLNARIAHDAGVPQSAETILGAGTSTWEDALVLGRWMRHRGVRRIVAVTSPTHSRRAAYTLEMALGPLSQGIEVYRCGAIYGPLWWIRERSLIRVSIESLKFGFYALRYFLPAAVGLTPAPPLTENAP